VRRVQMAQTLENAGSALESLAASVKGGHGDLGFMDAPSYEASASMQPCDRSRVRQGAASLSG
jgi:hypothetical protein